MPTATPSRKRGERGPKPGRSRLSNRALWIAAIAIVTIGTIVAMAMQSSRSEQPGTGKAAPPFAVTDTAGKTVSLAGLKGQSVLLYFNEGVGCDACFYQQVEIEKHANDFKALGVVELPVVMNPPDAVGRELTRFKLSTPYLIDQDGSVSSAYGVLGKGMHAGLPGHGFVLIDGDGVIRWQAEYPTMYLPANELAAKVEQNLPAVQRTAEGEKWIKRS